MWSKTTLGGALVCVLACSASAQTISLYRFQKEDVSILSRDNSPAPTPHWVGNVPSAVAYGKGRLFVGGLANGPIPATVAGYSVSVVKVNGVFATRSYDIIPSSQVLAPGTRGYTGLDYHGTWGLIASVDFGSGSDRNYLRFGVDASGPGTDLGSTPSSATRIGTAGVAWDFGPTGLGFAGRPAVAGINFGEGGPRGIDPSTMLLTPLVYSVGSGAPTSPIIVQDGGNTQWRDLSIDPRNGAIVGRLNNNVMGVTRSADGNGTPVLFQGTPRLNTPNSTTTISGQQVALMWGLTGTGAGGDVFIWNNRTTTATGQPFADVIKINRFSDGATVTPTWLRADGTALVFPVDIAPGNGQYDFFWDNQLQVLFVLDAATSFVEIFSVQRPGACCLPSGGGCVILPANVCTVVRAGSPGSAGSVCSPSPCGGGGGGACCAGVTCSIASNATACTGAGANRAYKGNGTICNAGGNNTSPCCRGDFNQDGTRQPADIFAFLNAYFSTDIAVSVLTDVDANGLRQPADIFGYLNVYFAGGC